MPILAVITAATAAVVFAAATPFAPTAAVGSPGAAGRRQGDGSKAAKAEVRFTTRLVRADSASLAEKPDPAAEQVLAAPVLTTLDGQTASVNVTGMDPTYAISLSPTVEKPGAAPKPSPPAGGGDAAKEIAPAATTIQVLWSVRLAGKTLPAGVSGVTMTGATRIAADRDEVIAELVLPDPKTGRVTRFRLVGRAVVNPASAPAAASPR